MTEWNTNKDNVTSIYFDSVEEMMAWSRSLNKPLEDLAVNYGIIIQDVNPDTIELRCNVKEDK